MNDIVKRLREEAEHTINEYARIDVDLLLEAADEIESLRKKLDNSVPVGLANSIIAHKQNQLDSERKRVSLPKHGRWIIKPHKMMGECPCCSECGLFNPIEYRYCPNCGAKMKSSKGAEE